MGTEAAEERNGDAVEAHAGDGGNGGLPVLDAGEVQQSRAEARQSARDDHGEDDVLVFLHAAVFGGVVVAAGGLQLVAEFGLVQNHPHQHRRQNRNEEWRW